MEKKKIRKIRLNPALFLGLLVFLAVSCVLPFQQAGVQRKPTEFLDAPPEQPERPLIFKPTATAIIRENFLPTAGNEIKGKGNFPYQEVLAPSIDGTAQAIYQIEGNTATEKIVLRKWSKNATVSFLPSPDKKYEAIFIRPGSQSASVLKIVHVQTGDSVDIYTSKGHLRNDDQSENINSYIWMDNEHILYNRVVDSKALNDVDPAEQIAPRVARNREVWISSLDGKDQKQIAVGPFYRLLGISRDGKNLYVTRLIEMNWGLEGFSVVNLESGQMENLWPAEEKPFPYYYGMRLITLPEGTPRVMYTYFEEGPGGTVTYSVPKVWLGDPESRKIEVIWDGKINGQSEEPNGSVVYDTPREIIWSYSGKRCFIYFLRGELWFSDLQNGVNTKIGRMFVGEFSDRTDNAFVIWNQKTHLLRMIDEKGRIIGQIDLTN